MNEKILSFVIWMTGLPCSGKTTIAKRLKSLINNLAVLDGDELREWLSPKDFSKDGRNEHNRKVAYLANLLQKHNVSVCVSLISPYAENREFARKLIGEKCFVEIYVKCSLKICETRDVKGMYKKARNKEIKNFTGISDDYEVPSHPDLIIDTESKEIEECTNQIINYLKKRNFAVNLNNREF